MATKALVVTDLQNCFSPVGTLPIAGGDRVIGPVERLLSFVDNAGPRWLICFSRDWHPAISTHFKKFGGPWPVHGVRGTEDALFVEGLGLGGLEEDVVISKAMGHGEDGYSPLGVNAYADPDGLTDSLGPDDDESEVVSRLMLATEYLEAQGVEELHFVGWATDYCVKGGVLDGCKLPFIKKVYVLTDAVAAVNVNPGDGDKALAEMQAAGAILTTTDAVIAGL